MKMYLIINTMVVEGFHYARNGRTHLKSFMSGLTQMGIKII